MTVSPEALLALLIIALYLNDSATLLYANEAIMEKGVSGIWKARFGARRFTLLGKHPYLGGLLPPHTPTFRLSWSMDLDLPPAPGWEEYARRLRPCGWAAAVSFLVVVLLVPLALITRAGDTVLLGLIGTTYISTVAASVILWVRRTDLGLTKAYCMRLCAEMLLCPPIAANLPRRLSLQHEVREDFISACRRLALPANWAIAAGQIKVRIDDEIEAEVEGSPRHARLTQRKGQFV